MPGLDDPRTLLAAWERAAHAPPAARGAALLPASPDEPLAATAARAAEAYVGTFGAEAAALLTCPACGETLEVVVDVAALAGEEPPDDGVTVPTGRGTLTVRPLTTADLLAVQGAVDPVAALAGRAVRDENGDVVDVEALSAAELEAVDDATQALAGIAAATVATACPACGEWLREPVDVAELLWEQVRSRATALMNQVATLASAFGWTEPEVLALPAARRAAYLAMVG
jgi:predicted RNA-binding Zn-ribbon protein involved in translation (DUF1610 family)